MTRNTPTGTGRRVRSSELWDTVHGVANHHFGKFADVWKHLVVDEVVFDAKPVTYA